MANEFKHKSVGSSLTENEYIAIDGHELDSQATGDLIYAVSATQLSRLGIGTTNHVLKGVGGVPTWSSEDYDANNLTGTVLASNVVTSSLEAVGTIGTGVWQGTAIADEYGGTGQSTYAQGDLLYASGADTLAKLALGSADQLLTVNSAGTQLEWKSSAGGGGGFGTSYAVNLFFGKNRN